LKSVKCKGKIGAAAQGVGKKGESKITNREGVDKIALEQKKLRD